MNHRYLLEFESEVSLPIQIRIYSLFFRKRINPSKLSLWEKREDSYQGIIEFISTEPEASVISKKVLQLVGVSDVRLEKK